MTRSEPTHIVGLSGGKDSTALALRLAEIEPRDYTYICNATGNELPEMVAHWEKLEVMLGKQIVRVTGERGLVDESRHQKMLPSSLRRWCTRILKIEPTVEYFSSLPAGSVLYVGLRADESERGGLYDANVAVRYPLREWGWGERNVIEYLKAIGVSIPWRTDCALCPFQRLTEWRQLFEDYPDLWADGVALEESIGATIRSPSRDSWPADMKSLGNAFASGRTIRKSSRRKKMCRVCTL